MKKLFYILLVPLSIFAQVTYQKSKFDQVWYDAAKEKSHSTFALFDTSSIKLYYTVTGKPLFDIYDQAGLRVFHLDSLGVTHADSLAVGTFLYSGANFADSLRGAGFTKDVDEWFDSNGILSAGIKNGAILNEDINSSAAISGTKINPNFGSQDVLTKGLFKHNVTDSTDDDEWLKPYGFFSRDTLTANAVVNPDGYGITGAEIRTTFDDNGGDGTAEWPVGMAVITDVPSGNVFGDVWSQYGGLYLFGSATNAYAHEAYAAPLGGTATKIVAYNGKIDLSGTGGESGNITNAIGVSSTFTGNPTAGSALTNGYGFKFTKPSAYTRYTNMYGLYLDSVVGVSGNAYSIYSAGGDAYFEDDVTADTVKAAIQDGRIYNAAINASAAIDGSKLADHGITYAKLDTGATGFVDVRKFGAVGDGLTDDTAALRAAIAGGRVVYFPSGTYLTDSVQVQANTVIFGHNAKLFGKSSYKSYILGIVGDNVKIIGLHFDGNDDNNGGGGNKSAINISSADSVEISDCLFENMYGYGIVSGGDPVHFAKILRNKIRITSSSGISFQTGVKLVWITDNYIESVTGNGIQVYHASADSNEDIHISRNTVKNNVATPIEIQRATRGEVSNNIVFGGGTNGLSVGGCSYLSITGNCVADQSSIAVELGYGSNISITGNTIRNCLSGIRGTDYTQILNGLTITGNMIVNTDSVSGAYAGGSAIEIYNTENCLISSNTITNPYRKGIVFGTSGAVCTAGDTVSGGVIIGNSIKFDSSWYNISRSTPIGISLSGINNVTIATNEIQSLCGDVDYYYYGGVQVGSIKCRNIRVIDNRFIGLASPIQMCAITTSSASGWTIKGNKVWGFRFGVHTYNYSGSDVTITDNDITGCTDAYYLHANNKLGYLYYNGNASFGNESPGAKVDVDGGGLLASDSLRVGAGGIWQRNWFYNAADSSLRIVFYNSTLARIDTVICPQP